MFISNQALYVADTKFMLFKVLVVLGTIGFGYLVAILCNGDPLREMRVLNVDIWGLQLLKGWSSSAGPWDTMCKSGVLPQILGIVSMLWFVTAIALLPFSHTVKKKNDEIDTAASDRLMTVQRIIYMFPILLIIVLFSLCLTLGIVNGVYNWNNKAEASTAAQPFDPNQLDVENTIGFYFPRKVQ
jgi:hypothetical protein